MGIPPQTLQYGGSCPKNLMKLLTCGCFDLLHYGHIKFFQSASRYGNVVVAVGDDDLVKRLKGEDRPIFTLDQRTAMLQACRYVSEVIPHGFNENMADEFQRLVDCVKPDAFIQGQLHGKGHAQIREVMDINEIPIITVNSVAIHTSDIVEKIRDVGAGLVPALNEKGATDNPPYYFDEPGDVVK